MRKKSVLLILGQSILLDKNMKLWIKILSQRQDLENIRLILMFLLVTPIGKILKIV